MKKAFKEAIEAKLTLWQVSNDQMRPDIEAGVLTAQTQECMHIAHESLEAAKIKLTQGRLADAVYLFSRGCWKMGEVIGRAAYEKVEVPDARPDSDPVRRLTSCEETD